MISTQTISTLNSGAVGITQTHRVSLQHKLIIEVIHNHIIYQSVHVFNFKVSRHILCAAHGLVILYNGGRSDTYCGRRVPWTMIIPSSKAHLRLTVTADVDIHLSLFYTTHRKNDIKRFIKHIYQQTSKSISASYGNSSSSIQYYIMASRYGHITFHVTASGPINGHVVIQDGPGTMSKTILTLENTNTQSDILVRTSAYWAFIRLYIEHNRGTIIYLKMEFERALTIQAIAIVNYHSRIYLVDKTQSVQIMLRCSGYFWEYL